MRKVTAIILFLATAGWLTMAREAGATLTVYTDKPTFLSSTGATSATGPLPSLVSSVSSLTVGTISFSGSLWFGAEFVSEVDWTTRLPGPDIAINDMENMDITTANPVTALGFDFVEPQFDPNINASFVDSTFTVSAYLDALLLGSFTFSAPNDTAYFVGFASDAAFNKVLIRETIGGIENEFFGQFYTNDTANQVPIPEPGTLGMFVMSLAGLGIIRLRRVVRL